MSETIKANKKYTGNKPISDFTPKVCRLGRDGLSGVKSLMPNGLTSKIFRHRGKRNTKRIDIPHEITWVVAARNWPLPGLWKMKLSISNRK